MRNLCRRPATLLFLAVASATVAIVLLRIHTGALPFDEDWAPLTDRLLVGRILSDFLAGDLPVGSLIGDLDSFGYPPGLHVASWMWTPLVGYEASAIRATGLFWLFLLAGSVGVVAQEVARPRRRTLSHGPTPSPGLTAAAGVLLLGSYQAVAAAYSYDLPFTALLWAGTALLLKHWDTRPLLAAVGGGGFFAAAALTKWTALAFGGVMGLGLGLFALTSRRRRRPSRLLACLGAGGVAATLIFGFLAASGPEGSPSLAAMTGTFDEAIERPPLEAALATARRLLEGKSADPLGKLDWYIERAVGSVLSPLLTWPLLGLLGSWLFLSRRGFLLFATIVGGQLAFLVLAVPVTDERFLLTALPAVIIAAALGMARLPRRLRIAVSLAIVLLASAVSYDFHFARDDTPLLSSAPVNFLGQGWELRRYGLENAWAPDLTWARGDAVEQDSGTALAGQPRASRQGGDTPVQEGARALLDALQRCSASRLVFALDSPPWTHQQSIFEATMMSEEFRRNTPRAQRFEFRRLEQIPQLHSFTASQLAEVMDLAFVDVRGLSPYYPPEAPPGLLEPTSAIAPRWGRLWRPVGTSLCDPQASRD